ncbi:MAG: sigma factor-like helix-turn-helix DNA-binding protein [Gammaproteobacteria bacterium]|nr:sigma factor-like helix-turn-helix DNA-binding protein [Gammaproteobacteria bacterium]
MFLMAHQEGLSYAEIARALRIPVGTVKSRMNKAVSQLMAVLEECD